MQTGRLPPSPLCGIANHPVSPAQTTLTVPVTSEADPILPATPPVNERITATPFPPANGASSATLPASGWCDWWPWMYAIVVDGRPWSNATPVPPPSVCTDTQ